MLHGADDMKLRQTEFFKALVAVVSGCVLAVASVAFVSIPLNLGQQPGAAAPTTMAGGARHLT